MCGGAWQRHNVNVVSCRYYQVATINVIAEHQGINRRNGLELPLLPRCCRVDDSHTATTMSMLMSYRSAALAEKRWQVYTNSSGSARSTVVVDSHIQRIVLATEETTVTQQVSHRPIKCQSRLWSQRGTNVNGSHRGDNPILRQQGSNRHKKFCDSTSNGTDQNQNGSSNLLTPYRGQPRSTRIVVAYARPSFSTTNRTNYAPTSFGQQVQVSQGRASIPPSKALCILDRSPLLVALVRRKMTAVRHQLFPQKPPGSRL